MASSSSSATVPTLTLVINKKTREIMYAEVGKQVIDLLIHFVSLPPMVLFKYFGCSPLMGGLASGLARIYQSHEKLKDEFDLKYAFSSTPIWDPSNVPLSLPNEEHIPTVSMQFSSGFKDTQFALPAPGVKDAVYILMDNLEFEPLSTTVVIDKLHEFGVTSSAEMELKEVSFSSEQGRLMGISIMNCDREVLSRIYGKKH